MILEILFIHRWVRCPSIAGSIVPLGLWSHSAWQRGSTGLRHYGANNYIVIANPARTG